MGNASQRETYLPARPETRNLGQRSADGPAKRLTIKGEIYINTNETKLAAVVYVVVLVTAGSDNASAQATHEDIINNMRLRLPQNWSTFTFFPLSERWNPASGEFQLDAVQDRDTGLLWERTPDITLRNWFEASARCRDLVLRIGGLLNVNRKGWRLPTVQELLTLIDPEQTNPALPPDHPFVVTNLTSRLYWTITQNASTETGATPQYNEGYLVNIQSGETASRAKTSGDDIDQRGTWCVRSPFPAGGDVQ
jgi:uncharacterized protein DUF1566